MLRSAFSFVLLLAVVAACSSADSGAGDVSETGDADASVAPDTTSDTTSGDVGALPDQQGDLLTPPDLADIATDTEDAGAFPDLLDIGDAPDLGESDGDAPGDTTDAPDVTQVPCTVHEDCAGGVFVGYDECQMPACVGGFCTLADIVGCCLDDRHCHDWDPCTDDACVIGTRQCTNTPIAGCCQGSWTIQESFEGDLLPVGWEADDPVNGARWHLRTGAGQTGARAVEFNDPTLGTYDTGFRAAGRLRGPWFDVPQSTDTPLLRFDLLLDTEWRTFTGGSWNDPSPLLYDRFDILLEEPDGNETLVWTSYAAEIRGTTCDLYFCDFRSYRIDLSDWEGLRVRPVFAFDSGDHVDNAYRGPVLDNVGVLLSCGLPPECLTSADCDDGDPCTNNVCLNEACVFEPNYNPGCCYESTITTWTFDPENTQGFDIQPPGAPVRWHASSERAATLPSSLRFGNPVNTTFDNPGSAVAGTADSPSVGLMSWPWLALEFNVWIDVEDYDPLNPQRDLFRVLVVSLIDNSTTVIWDRSSVAPADHRRWLTVRVPLSSFGGQSVRLRLQFSSGDPESNHGEGVYVDNMKILRACE